MSRTLRWSAVSMVALTCLLVSASAAVAARPAATRLPAITPPTDTQQQVEADRPIPVPTTASCTETISTHDFASSYYAPDIETYTPPAGCPGPWNKVVLTLTSTVSGTQFDRLVDVTVGDAELLHGSTSEPGTSPVTWTVQRDVTQYTSLFETDQPVLVQLDNVTDSTYTGIYHTVVSLTFYETGPTAPAPAVPDVVLPLSQVAGELATPKTQSEPEFYVQAVGQKVGSEVTFPRNLSRLTAELFADGHGADEEFWWGDPSMAGSGTPYREVAIYLDGVLAGAAPVYPVTFTGADGPGFWEPIPSTRAWNLRPYDVDLTPFVGTLTDGQPHSVQLGVLHATYAAGDYWPVAANLLAYEQHSTPVTTGALDSSSAPAAPTDTITGGGGVAYVDDASHALSWTGHIDSPTGPIATTVTDANSEHSNQPGQAGADNASWDWDQKVSTVAAGHTNLVDTDLSYSLLTTPDSSFHFTDDGTTTTSLDGNETAQQVVTESLTTADATGLAADGAESEKYGYADTDGTCYEHELDAQAGEVTVDHVGQLCPTVSAVGTALPEAPYTWWLLAVGAGVVGVVVRRRRIGPT